MNDIIKLVHGDGGKHTHDLIESIFYEHFRNDLLINGIDTATFAVKQGRMAFTTDSFVVKPLFFKGGDIGKLAVYGTVNDLAVSGAKPLYLSTAFIIEEGFPLESLKRIVVSIGDACMQAGVKVVTGDTKVVEKGRGDGIFINTCGVGIIEDDFSIKPIEEGDRIIVTGGIGEHGTAIALDRYDIKVKGNFESDCAPLNKIVMKLKRFYLSIKIMKDPTRGGLATALNEIASLSGLGVRVDEGCVPLRKEVKAANELLGLDPLYMACEGRLILVVSKEAADSLLEEIIKIEGCEEAKIIGNFVKEPYNMVYMETFLGGKRILNMLEGEMLPRIC